MKKILTVLCLTATMTFIASAEDAAHPKKKHEASPEMKALLEKYDTNKDGKLDKEERAKLTAEDKAKLKESHQAPSHEKKAPEAVK